MLLYMQHSVSGFAIDSQQDKCSSALFIDVVPNNIQKQAGGPGNDG
jgi:hypothetical protein